MRPNIASWRRAASGSRRGSLAARPRVDRDRSRERRWPADDLGDARYRPTDDGRAYAHVYRRSDDRDRLASAFTGHRAHSASDNDTPTITAIAARALLEFDKLITVLSLIAGPAARHEVERT
jgi:hypothetical protein